MYEQQDVSLNLAAGVAVVVLVLWLLGGVAAAIAVPLNSSRRARRVSTTGRLAPDSTRLIAIFALYGAALLGIIVGIVLGNVTGPSSSGYSCPSVFQWNGLAPVQQSLVDAIGGGACAGHVARMTAAMVFAFVLAAIATAVATILTVARLTSRRPSGQASPPAWHPIAGQPGKLRWWDGTAWTDQIHDQNGPQS